MPDTDPYGLASAREQAGALGPVLDDLEARSEAFGTALAKAFASAVSGGKSLDDALKGVALRLSGMALSAGLKPLENLLGTALGQFGNALGGSATAFAKNGVTPFADGGVVSAPTYFGMSSGSGLGLMGEAGAEAILPLKRGSDGALGVAVAGGGGSAPIIFNVTATDANSFRRSEAQISAMLARTVRRGQRQL